MKRLWPIFLVLVVIIVTFISCGQINTTEEPDDAEDLSDQIDTEPQEPMDVEPTEPEYTGPYNPLTGLPCDEDYTNVRPFAVMINNVQQALPQVGISQADQIYEITVEGGLTRLLAVYQDIYDVDVVGSVRSCRHYYLDIAQSLDAIYIHAGGSPQGYSAISSRGIDNIDGVNGPGTTFYRDSYRMSNMGYEHSLMLSPELLPAYLEKYNFRTEHTSDYKNTMIFTDNATPVNGGDATRVAAHFISKTTSFEYNAEDNLYYVYTYGNPQMDGGNDQQLAVTNVVILKASTVRIAGDSSGRMDVTLTGTGSGYFACGGKYEEITWSKDSYSSPFVYTQADGSLLAFERGKTFFCILPIDCTAEFE